MYGNFVQVMAAKNMETRQKYENYFSLFCSCLPSSYYYACLPSCVSTPPPLILIMSFVMLFSFS